MFKDNVKCKHVLYLYRLPTAQNDLDSKVVIVFVVQEKQHYRI